MVLMTLYMNQVLLLFTFYYVDLLTFHILHVN